MTPDFKVLAAGFDITGQIKDRLLSISVSDEAGTKSDAVEIVLDDRDSALELPMPGAPLIVAMGYRETFMMPMGVFTSDEISLSGWPRTMTLRGKAANLGGEIKSQKSRSWDDKTIDDIVSTIAGEHGLQPKVAEPLKAIKYKHLDQTDESDIHFLNRIGKDHDAMATVKGGALLFMARGRGLTVSGLAMLPRPITRASVLSYGAELVNRANWKCVEATWHDLKAGQRKTVKAGSGAPVKRLRHVYPNEDEAKKAAEAALGEATRGTTSLNLTLIGDPTISAEGRILVTGIRLGVDGLWSVKSARHAITDSGFTTTIQAELPGA
jgi:hypothetical protein